MKSSRFVERESMTWEDVGTAVEELAGQIEAAQFTPDAVLALARGGLPAGGALAYALGVKNMATLNVEFYTGPSTSACRSRSSSRRCPTSPCSAPTAC